MSYEQYKQNLKVLNLRPCMCRSTDDIKTAYRKLVLKHHPDRFKTQANKDKATENFKRITKAYEQALADFNTYKNFEEPKQEQKQTKKKQAKKPDVIVKSTQKRQEKQRQKPKHAPIPYKAKLDFDTLFSICFDEVIM